MTLSSSRAALLLVVVLCGAYVLSHFYRTSVGVIGPSLMGELGLSAEALGALGGVFFLIFAAAQLPAGVLLDRFGPRMVMPLFWLVAALGAAIFATADSGTLLTLGRGVMGLGCATAYIGALVLFSRWFSAERFPPMASLVMGVGQLGSLLATTPLAVVAVALGWRGAFLSAAAVTVAMAAVVWLVVRDAPPGETFHGEHRQSLAQTVKGIGELLTNRQLVLLLPLNTVSYAAVAAVLGLWGAPYLRDVHGLAVVDGADVLFTLSLMIIAGTLSYGWIAPRIGSFKWMTVGGAGALCLLFATLALLPRAAPAVVFALFAAIGFLGAYTIILVSHVRAIIPRRLVGRGLTLANLFNFGGVGLVQVISGWIVGAWPAVDGARPAAAYATLFWCLSAAIGIALLFYLRTRNVALSAEPEPG
jgi:sugar phosphate permease